MMRREWAGDWPDVVAGATVYIRTRQGLVRAAIERVTNTQVTVAGRKYRRGNGTAIGKFGVWDWPPTLVSVTGESMAEYETQQARLRWRKTCLALSEHLVKWASTDPDPELQEAIAALLDRIVAS